MAKRLTIDDLRDKAEEIKDGDISYEFHAGRNYGYRPGFLVRYGDKEIVFKNMRECLSWMEGYQIGRMMAWHSGG